MGLHLGVMLLYSAFLIVFLATGLWLFSLIEGDMYAKWVLEERQAHKGDSSFDKIYLIVHRPISLPNDWSLEAQHYVDQLAGSSRKVRIWGLAGTLLYQDADRSLATRFPQTQVDKLTALNWTQYTRQPAPGPLRSSFLGETYRQHNVIPLCLEGQPYGYIELSSHWAGQRNILFLVEIAAGWIFLSLGLSKWASHRMAAQLAAPLEQFADVCRQVSEGNLSARLNLGPGQNEIVQVAQVLDTMVDRVQDSFANQQRFVADASHELKTPVTALTGLCEMLKTFAVAGPPERCQRTLEMMDRELARMKSLIGDLLTLSTAEQGAIAVNSAVDLGAIIAAAAQGLVPVFPEHKIDVVLPTQALWMLGDAESLERVFRNVLENACRHTPSQFPIHVSCAFDVGLVQIFVADQGCGIPAEYLEQVFERFYRIDASRASSSGGRGLGLAIARAIVERHGGQIVLNSDGAAGTTVSLKFPTHRAIDP